MEHREQEEWTEEYYIYPGYHWTLRLGTFQRTAGANPERATRHVNIESCTIAKDGTIGDRDFCSDVFTIIVDDQGRRNKSILGGIVLSQRRLSLYLPPPVFDQMWAAAEKTDGMQRRLSVGFRVESGHETDDVFPIIEATLIEEFAPEDAEITYDNKTGSVKFVRPQRQPVLAEVLKSLTTLTSEMRTVRGVLILVAVIEAFLTFHWLK